MGLAAVDGSEVHADDAEEATDGDEGRYRAWCAQASATATLQPLPARASRSGSARPRSRTVGRAGAQQHAMGQVEDEASAVLAAQRQRVDEALSNGLPHEPPSVTPAVAAPPAPPMPPPPRLPPPPGAHSQGGGSAPPAATHNALMSEMLACKSLRPAPPRVPPRREPSTGILDDGEFVRKLERRRQLASHDAPTFVDPRPWTLAAGSSSRDLEGAAQREPAGPPLPTATADDGALPGICDDRGARAAAASAAPQSVEKGRSERKQVAPADDGLAYLDTLAAKISARQQAAGVGGAGSGA